MNGYAFARRRTSSVNVSCCGKCSVIKSPGTAEVIDGSAHCIPVCKHRHGQQLRYLRACVQQAAIDTDDLIALLEACNGCGPCGLDNNSKACEAFAVVPYLGRWIGVRVSVDAPRKMGWG